MDSVCVGDHTKHLCLRMTNPLVDDTALEQLKTLIRDPRFVCKNCGRSARLEENLCNPVPL